MCSLFSNTYIFEEPLHEGEPEVVGHSTRVSSVDMFFVASRELLGFFTFAAVSQHCQSQDSDRFKPNRRRFK